MRRLAGLLMLSGCAGPNAYTPQGFCAAQANRDPAVKALIITSVSNPSFLNQSGSQIAAAKSAAEFDCLKRQGVMPAGGGVQAPQRGSDTLFP